LSDVIGIVRAVPTADGMTGKVEVGEGDRLCFGV
jgi:hypothetical protein